MAVQFLTKAKKFLLINIDSASYYSNLSVTHAGKTPDPKLRIRTAASACKVLKARGKWADCLSCYYFLLQKSDSLALNSISFAISINIGNIEFHLAEIEKANNFEKAKIHYHNAEEHYQHVLPTAKRTQDTFKLSHIYTNLGAVQTGLKNDSLALKYFLLALNNMDSDSEDRRHGNLLSNLGVVYENLGLLATAMDNYQSAFNIFTKIKDLNGQIATAMNLAEIARARKKTKSALHYSKSALNLANDLEDEKWKIQCQNQLVEIFDEVNMTDSSYKILQTKS